MTHWDDDNEPLAPPRPMELAEVGVFVALAILLLLLIAGVWRELGL